MVVEATVVEQLVAQSWAVLYNAVLDPLHMDWSADKQEGVEQRLTT